MTNVVQFTGLTTLDINPDGVLESAVGKLDQVWVIGIGKDGEDYIASSTSNTKDFLMLIETVKFKLMRGDFG